MQGQGCYVSTSHITLRLCNERKESDARAVKQTDGDGGRQPMRCYTRCYTGWQVSREKRTSCALPS
jgi:hypothetical protein